MKIEKNKKELKSKFLVIRSRETNKYDKQTINETEQSNKQSVLEVNLFGLRISLTGSKS